MSESTARKALVTGGGNGFGLATTKALLAQGAQVAIGDIDPTQLKKVEAELASDRALTLELDVTSKTSVQRAVAACGREFDGLDALVNSAGVIDFAPLDAVKEENWDRVIAVDLKGVFLCCQAAAPLLRESGRRGRIVNIGSDASKLGWPTITAYTAAKFGVVGLTKSIAGELAHAGVTVNCVCPAGVSTTGMGKTVLDWKGGATGKKPKAILDATASEIPLGRNPTEADVVNAIMFFLSDASDFLTGVALDVEGGLLSTTAAVPGT